jgi:hypothetical protein
MKTKADSVVRSHPFLQELIARPILILPILAVVLTGCNTLHRTPEWVDNPKTAYPENEYLVAVGEGDTRRAAENAADANLSKIFEAHIQSDERLIDQSFETNDTFDRTTDFTTDINILSSQTLHNIQHAESWRDDRARVHAIAYLDRRETARIYREKIEEKTARVEFLMAHAEQTDDLLQKYSKLHAAALQAAANAALLRQLKVIHPSSASFSTPGYSENVLRKNLADTAKKIRVNINLTGDDQQRMTSVIKELITRYGFVVGTPSVLNIDGRIAITDTGQRTSDLVFVRYELAVQIKDAEGSLLIAVNDKGREGHVTLAEARVRSFRTMENTIRLSGASRLDEYFNTLTDPIPQ